MAIEINRGIEPFDDRLDTTRSNPDRKPFGRSANDGLDFSSEYNPQAPPPPVPDILPPPAPKFTHKLANGTVLEAATVEELAAKIEQAISQAPLAPVLEFEDKPLYQHYEFKPKELTLQEQAEILNLMKENPQAAMRKLQEADLGAPTAEILRILNGTQQVLRQRLEDEAGAEFMMEAETYNPTLANGKKLTAYLREKGKPITKTNLLVAFNHLVAAGDKNMRRPVEEAPPVDDGLREPPPPPTIVPSNTGLPEAAPANQIDPQKFAAMSLDQQQHFFKKLNRRA